MLLGRSVTTHSSFILRRQIMTKIQSSLSSFFSPRGVNKETSSHIQEKNSTKADTGISITGKSSPKKAIQGVSKKSKVSGEKARRRATAISSSSDNESNIIETKEIENTSTKIPPTLAAESTGGTEKKMFSIFKDTPDKASPSGKKRKLDSDAINDDQKKQICEGSLHSPSWSIGEDVPYSALCETFQKIEDISARLKILEILTAYFRSVMELSPHSMSMKSKLAPDFEGLELGVGETLLMKAVAGATGRTVDRIKAEVAVKGDLGKVAEASRNTQPTLFKPKPLNILSVQKTLKEIAKFSGGSSMSKKVDKIKFLLVSCKGFESKYLIRSLEGKLRIGLAEQSVLVALAHADILHRYGKSHKGELLEAKMSKGAAIMKAVYSELPSYDIIIPHLLKYGVEELEKQCTLTPGIPLKPMLAHPTKSITEVLNRFEGITFTCEFKYDGERGQIHKLENGDCRIYSRNSENMSEKYPDIVQVMATNFPNPDFSSFVLDCEVVAWDVEKKCILPFQVLSTRKRKGVTSESIQVQVCLFAFDLLYFNNQPLIKKSFKERRETLYHHFKEVEGKFMFAKSITASSVEDIEVFLEESMKGNCEGLMIKTYDKESTYEPSKRSRNWLKVKKDYLSGVGDSLDLVVIGAFRGKGKRTGVYGGFLLAVWDPENETYQSVCKIGTGFSEADLDAHSKFFKDHIIEAPKPYYIFGDSTKPDVWFDAVQVWEVLTADLSISPVHKAAIGLVDSNKGISLRFPRFVRVRDDKGPEDATTSEQIADMYRNQQINHPNGEGECNSD